MRPKDLGPGAAGRVIQTSRNYWAFVPAGLPPHVEMTELASLVEEAGLAVGDLRGAGARLPNPHILIRPFVRREAVLSSRIEGTQASFSDLLFFEAASQEAPRPPDVTDVANYVRAVDAGIARLAELPLSLRLCREMHALVMADHPHASPGNFRTTQNWIGPAGCTLNEATYVPPPVEEMHECLRDWEQFLHVRGPLPVLVQAAILHYQFEAIHPFVDGNGRVGRLLVALFLAERAVMPQPLLYLSAFFEKYRSDYYRLLLDVSRNGAWADWIAFFLRGVRTQAAEAGLRVDRLLSLQATYRDLALRQGRAALSIAALIDGLLYSPAITVRQAERLLGVTFAAAQKHVDRLVSLGLIREVTGNARNRMYLADEIYKAAFEEIGD